MQQTPFDQRSLFPQETCWLQSCCLWRSLTDEGRGFNTAPTEKTVSPQLPPTVGRLTGPAHGVKLYEVMFCNLAAPILLSPSVVNFALRSCQDQAFRIQHQARQEAEGPVISRLPTQEEDKLTLRWTVYRKIPRCRTQPTWSIRR